MREIKKQLTIKIICTSLTFIMVIFIALYMKSYALYTNADLTIYIPKKEQSSSLNVPQSKKDISYDNISSKIDSPKAIMPIKNNNKSKKETSSKVESTRSSKILSEESSNTTTSIETQHTYYNTTTIRHRPLPKREEDDKTPQKSSSNTKPAKPESTDDTSKETPPETSEQTSSETIPQTSEQTSSETSQVTSSEEPEESSDTSSDTSPQTPVETPEQKENKQKAKEISTSYGVSVDIPYNESDYTSEYIASYSTDVDEIKNGLTQLESALSSFPKEYFSKTSTTANVILVSKTTTDIIVLQEQTIIVPCFKTASSSQINSFLLKISADYLLSQLNPDYTKYNPNNFIYGTNKPKPQYVYSPAQVNRCYFISSKAQKSMKDDLYENFMAIFNNEKTLKKLPSYSPLYKKFKYTCELLYEWSDCFSEIKVVDKFL